MLSRALARTLPSAGRLVKQAAPHITQPMPLRYSATYAVQLPPMAHQPLSFLYQPQKTSPAQTAAATMASGKLVSDELVATMLESYLRTNAQDGWVLDGFPRNSRQAEMLVSHMGTRPDVVIELVVSHDDIRERILNRRVDSETGAVYNLTSDIPSDPTVLARLEKRVDDCEEVIERRFKVYEEAMPGVRNVLRSHGVPVVQVIAGRGASVEEVARKVGAVAKGKRVVLAGAPGCGKGTQGVLLADLIGGEHVSTGDLLRKAARLAREGLAGIIEQREIGGVARASARM